MRFYALSASPIRPGPERYQADRPRDDVARGTRRAGVAVARVGAFAGQQRGRGLFDQFAPAVERRSVSAGGERGNPAGADGEGGAAPPAAPPENAGERCEKKTAKPAGKKPGAKGFWRSQPIVVSAEIPHAPIVCAACHGALGPNLERRCVGAHNSLELARGEMALQVTATKHVYFAVRCPCGHRSIARPGVGSRSDIEGRRRNLQMSECCLVGPMLATFIAALSLRFRLSRRKIQEFLGDWLNLELGVATIERCIHEFGLASEPVVEQLIQEVRAADIVHLDETPWYQRGVLRWMWVATTAMTTIFRIASRRKEELTALIGDAFLGWLVTDG